MLSLENRSEITLSGVGIEPSSSFVQTNRDRSRNQIRRDCGVQDHSEALEIIYSPPPFAAAPDRVSEVSLSATDHGLPVVESRSGQKFNRRISRMPQFIDHKDVYPEYRVHSRKRHKDLYSEYPEYPEYRVRPRKRVVGSESLKLVERNDKTALMEEGNRFISREEVSRQISIVDKFLARRERSRQLFKDELKRLSKVSTTLSPILPTTLRFQPSWTIAERATMKSRPNSYLMTTAMGNLGGQRSVFSLEGDPGTTLSLVEPEDLRKRLGNKVYDARDERYDGIRDPKTQLPLRTPAQLNLFPVTPPLGSWERQLGADECEVVGADTLEAPDVGNAVEDGSVVNQNLMSDCGVILASKSKTHRGLLDRIRSIRNALKKIRFMLNTPSRVTETETPRITNLPSIRSGHLDAIENPIVAGGRRSLESPSDTKTQLSKTEEGATEDQATVASASHTGTLNRYMPASFNRSDETTILTLAAESKFGMLPEESCHRSDSQERSDMDEVKKYEESVESGGSEGFEEGSDIDKGAEVDRSCGTGEGSSGLREDGAIEDCISPAERHLKRARRSVEPEDLSLRHRTTRMPPGSEQLFFPENPIYQELSHVRDQEQHSAADRNGRASEEPGSYISSKSNGEDSNIGLEFKEILSNLVSFSQQGVFDYLMHEFYIFFNQTWSTDFKSCAGSSSSSSGSNETSVNLLGSRTMEGSSRKGKRVRRDPEEDENDKEDGDNSKKSRSDLPAATALRRLACPYFKREPRRFGSGTSYHVCAGQGFKDLAKMKEHLYRRHYSSFQCPRCKTILKSQSELDEHSEATDICQSRPRTLEDGFNIQTFLLLHSKRKTSRRQTEEERWKEIFKLLFPDEPVPMAPYVTFVEIGDFQPAMASELEDQEKFDAYQQREVPIEFARRATVEVLKSSVPITRQLISQVPGMIRDSQDAVRRTYQGTTHPEGSTIDLTSSCTSNPLSNLHCESQEDAGTANFDLPTLNGLPQLGEIGQALGATNLESVNPPDPDFISGLRVELFSGESAALFLQVLRDFSRRLTKLEQPRERPLSHSFGSLPLSSSAQPTVVQSGSLSSIAEDPIMENTRDPNSSFNFHADFTELSMAPNEPANLGDAGDDYLDWEYEEVHHGFL